MQTTPCEIYKIFKWRSGFLSGTYPILHGIIHLPAAVVEIVSRESISPPRILSRETQRVGVSLLENCLRNRD